MTTKEIATRLVHICRKGKIEEAKEELFAPDIISIEPREGMLPKETKGMDAIKKKAELFISMERKTNSEICVYKTNAGKIISEQFFY